MTDIRLVGEARLTEMHLVVDHAGEQEFSGAVDLVACFADLCRDLFDTAIADEDIANGGSAFVNDGYILDDSVLHAAKVMLYPCRWMENTMVRVLS